MATLGGSGGQPNFVAAVTASGNSLVVVPASLLTNDPRAIELWLIPAGRNPSALARAHSAGPADPARYPAGARRPPDPDAALAVSLEPPGGSPTGLPTGPVDRTAASSRACDANGSVGSMTAGIPAASVHLVLP